MLPEPLHPAIVHFPIVLMVLLPVFMVSTWVLIRRGRASLRAWLLPTGLAVLLVASSWLAVRTGEAQEERVEEVVAEAPLETHEEAAEAFLALAVVVGLVTVLGLARGRIGQAGRALGTAGALALIAAGARVGHSGGELVYRHGAARAYANEAATRVVGGEPDMGPPVGGTDHDDEEG